jgi:hypothetical protein
MNEAAYMFHEQNYLVALLQNLYIYIYIYDLKQTDEHTHSYTNNPTAAAWTCDWAGTTTDVPTEKGTA